MKIRLYDGLRYRAPNDSLIEAGTLIRQKRDRYRPSAVRTKPSLAFDKNFGGQKRAGVITGAAVKPHWSGGFRWASFEIQPMHPISKPGAQSFRAGLLRCKPSSSRHRQVR